MQFRNQPIITLDNKLYWKEFLHPDIPTLLKKLKEKWKIKTDIELLEIFTKEVKKENNNIENHFNMFAETIIDAKDKINKIILNTKEKIVFEILEETDIQKIEYFNKLKEYLKQIRVNNENINFAFDDFPIWISKEKNILNNQDIPIIKIDYVFFQNNFKEGKSILKYKLFKITELLISINKEKIIIEWIETKEHYDFILKVWKEIEKKYWIKLLLQGFYIDKLYK